METKKLTCCDLMVGDIICYCKENNYVTKVESIHNTGHASVSDEYCIKCFRDRKDPLYDKNPIDFFNVEILHPISLTAEILEKNGFTRLGTKYILEGEHFALDNPSNPNNYLDNYWLRISINAVNIEYVHELQRALRFLKIDKNIAL